MAKGAHALGRLSCFDGYVLGGDQLTVGGSGRDLRVPAVRGIAKSVLGADPVAALPGLGEYLARVGQRPTVRRVFADRKADMPAFHAHLQELCAPTSASRRSAGSQAGSQQAT